jgi:short-subunit dehydrogenase
VNVDGSTVLVTGASSGIGACLAERLAGRGAVVGLVARRQHRLAEVLDRCRRSSPASRMWVADLGDLVRAEALALEAWDELGGVDVVVHNAAIPKRRRVTALTAEEVEAVMRVNFLSPVRMTLALLPRMLERDHGLIVNVSSLGGRLGIAAEAAYSSSKFALCGWSESLAMDLWGTGVGVRLIIPGAIDTEIWDQPDNDPPLYAGPREPPDVVADGIVAAIEGDRFEHYLPDLKAVVEFKTGDPDAFFAGAVAALADGTT